MSLSLLLLQAAILVSATCSSSIDYTPDALADEVTSLPGAEALEPLGFRQFSGYLTIPTETPGNSKKDEQRTKHLHYWFVESESNPDTAPVAFWTNGGPGCSGLLGFFTEQGPLRPNADLTLSRNEYSWNKIANMVFLEVPCGVGFSYSDNPDVDYHTDDAQTAVDNYYTIQAFFDRFPQLRSNDMYLTSESYGGHYLPTLSKEIVDRQAQVQQGKSEDLPLNFRGFAVGNPATTFYSAIPASMDTYWGHQLISRPLWDKYVENCKSVKRNWANCEYLFLAMYEQVGDLNPYALDYPVCTEDSRVRKHGRSQRNWFMNFQFEAMIANTLEDPSSSVSHSFVEQQNQMLARLRSAVGLVPVDGYEPCEEDYMTAYLQQENVRVAIHVNSSSDFVWQDCSRSLRYKQTDGAKSVTSYYNYLLNGESGYKPALNILVYSGDDDDVCATIGTQSWIYDLGYDVTPGCAWQTWEVDEGQTAGYLTQWKDVGFAFATVHGAGHEVPTYKPKEALYLFQQYINGALTR